MEERKTIEQLQKKLIGKSFKLTGIDSSEMIINHVKERITPSILNEDGSISPQISTFWVSENGNAWIQYLDRDSYCTIGD